MKRVFSVLALGIACLGVAGTAHATLVLEIIDPSNAANFVKITDGGACVAGGTGSCGGGLTDGSSAAGSVSNSATLTLGSFTISSLNAVTATSPLSKITSTSNTVSYGGAGSASLDIIAYDTFTVPVSTGLVVSTNGSASGSDTSESVSFTGYAGAPIIAFPGISGAVSTGATACTPWAAGPPASCNASAVSAFVAANNNPFSLTGLTHITLNTGQSVDTTDRVQVTAVPEPGSMALLGSGLFLLAGAARRRKNAKK